jgi:hypothetical protein
VAASAVGCAKPDTLTVKPGEPAPAEIVPSPQLEEFAYKKILMLPYEGKIDVRDLDLQVVSTKDSHWYGSRVERALLSQGFDVISSEIVARAQKNIRGANKMSSAEKALVMGKETQADAVFMVQSLGVFGQANFYRVDDLKVEQIEPGRVKYDEKKQRHYHADTEECLVRVPYYEVHFEGKLVDAYSGNVLWVGTGKQTSIDAFSESWVAKLGKHCEIVEQNFIYDDYIGSETALAETVGELVNRMVTPLKKLAFAGKPLKREEDKPKPKPEPPKVEEPKAVLAIVSSDKAVLRAGPGKRNQKIGYVPRKAKVEVVETMGEWSKVKVQDGSMGWMHESAIILNQ